MSNAREQGRLRQSQLLTTFGPGAMVDLPKYSVLVGGLDLWHGHKKRIAEERLASRVGELLGIEGVELYAPPVESTSLGEPSGGVEGVVFPAWFLGQIDATHTDPATRREYRTRPLVKRGGHVKRQYLAEDKKLRPIVPVRFVQACRNGHISDLDWIGFAHHNTSSACRGPLWMDESGTGGDFAEIFVRCGTCGARRPLSDAKVPEARVLGSCLGHRPWIGSNADEPCVDQDPGAIGAEPNRLLVRSATNAYFSQVLSVISIPDKDAALRAAVDALWEDELRFIEDLGDLTRERKRGKPKIVNGLDGLADDEVWSEIARRKTLTLGDRKSIKQAELETLLASAAELGEDVPDDVFFARTRTLGPLPKVLEGKLDRVVLVHRLREVVAQVGFTRFEAAMPDIDGELSLDVRRGALAREITWVPAIENRGEGVLLVFNTAAIEAWLDRKEVRERGRQLEDGFNIWCHARNLEGAVFPGLPYVLLHSLSHLLVTSVALACGYASSAIRERIYATKAGFGVLLHTGGAGTEGTLGGLVAVGRHIEHDLARALEMGALCSNDPICAAHEPADSHEERYLQGAACHGCVLIAETSCERRNELLDRALVIPTVQDGGSAFFSAPGGET